MPMPQAGIASRSAELETYAPSSGAAARGPIPIMAHRVQKYDGHQSAIFCTSAPSWNRTNINGLEVRYFIH